LDRGAMAGDDRASMHLLAAKSEEAIILATVGSLYRES
jgi:hypothetical protein